MKAVSADSRRSPEGSTPAITTGSVNPGLSGYHHAPTGLGEGVDVIPLKRLGDIRRGRPQLRASPGKNTISSTASA